jgi:succinyl-CoA synthetase beta subunit
MKLLEYQAKKILSEAGLPVPGFVPIRSADEVPGALASLGIKEGVAKVQVFAGGRGKAGGVKLFSGEEAARAFATRWLGATLVTHQTGPEGVPVREVLLSEACTIARELYLAITLDRTAVSPLIMLSPDGGMEIEEVSAKTPERILKLYPEFGKPLSASLLEQATSFMKLEGKQADQFHDILQKLYQVYLNTDSMLLEINPLVVTEEGNLLLIDCKMDIDDNALFRQGALGGDSNAEKTHSEIEAASFGMSYISMDGNIGCMVNGAGLAMATMDSIKYSGGSPANFLDVGGSATEQAVAEAIAIIAGDHAVECILVNIFGGIMRCDTIATGIVAAVSKSVQKIPMVVRLEGNNVELGKEILAKSGLNIQSADSLDEAAKKAVSLTRKIS